MRMFNIKIMLRAHIWKAAMEPGTLDDVAGLRCLSQAMTYLGAETLVIKYTLETARWRGQGSWRERLLCSLG